MLDLCKLACFRFDIATCAYLIWLIPRSGKIKLCQNMSELIESFSLSGIGLAMPCGVEGLEEKGMIAKTHHTRKDL